jgi:hypothetical protein
MRIRKATAVATVGVALGSLFAGAIPASAAWEWGQQNPVVVQIPTVVQASTVVQIPIVMQGPTVMQAEQVTPSPYYTETRYRTKEICIHQLFTSGPWTPGDQGNAFEPAVITGWRSASQGCGDYPGWQVMRVALYSAADGRCTKVTGTTNLANIYIGHPMNQWYDTLWTNEVSYPTAWINQYYNDTCWDTPFEQDNRLGKEMANMLGLEGHCSWVLGQEAVANSCGDVPWQATALDRNRLTVLMNPRRPHGRRPRRLRTYRLRIPE